MARILIAEGDPLVARMLVECLRPLGVETVTVPSGREVEAEVRAAAPDLILLDALLPDLDGFAVAARLQADVATRHVPFILLTAAGRVEDRTRGLALGAADCLAKPFYYEEVRARVQGVLQRAAAAPPPAPPAAPGAAVQGRLQDLSLPLVIQMLEMERKTGTLELQRGQDRGYLHFDDGQIVAARWRAHRGELAAYRLILWAEGTFHFLPAAARMAPEDRIRSTNQHLTMEAMRRQDEMERLLGDLPPRHRPLRATPRLAAALAGRRPAAELKQVLDLIDGRRSLADILEAAPDDLRTLEALARMHARGLVEAA